MDRGADNTPQRRLSSSRPHHIPKPCNNRDAIQRTSRIIHFGHKRHRSIDNTPRAVHDLCLSNQRHHNPPTPDQRSRPGSLCDLSAKHSKRERGNPISIHGHPQRPRRLSGNHQSHSNLRQPVSDNISNPGRANPLHNHYNVVVSGSDEIIQKSASLIVVATGLDFAMTASPSSLTFQQGTIGTQKSTIFLVSLNGFSGNVAVTATATSYFKQYSNELTLTLD